jgi:hypothetical protein
MKKMLILILSLTSLTSFAADAGKSAINYEGNLALIPAADPAATNAPAILPALQGVHPRVLFTGSEIAALKATAASDPTLSKAAAEAISWGKTRVKLPAGNPPDICKSDTPALTTSFGRYVNLAYAYALTGDPAIKNNIVAILQVMLDQPYWADAKELDCNMGAGNNMFMVGTLFDTVYNDLDPVFRLKMAEKILIHVRRMYYLGHKELALDCIKYWQQDTQNNHRWHRNAGMTACLMAIADIPELKGRTEYLLQQMKQEIDFVLKWWPADGDCHEGAGYQQFGFLYLALTAQIWDRDTGSEYLRHPGFANAWAQQLHYWAPGRQSYMTFGDAPNTEKDTGNLGMAFFLSPKISRDKDVQAAVMNFYKKNSLKGGKNNVDWSLLAVYDPTVGEGDYTKVTPHHLFPDLGAASMRDNWTDDAVLFTFKCGPYGGYKLNEYSHANPKDGKPHYVNVAHDDPDANSFAMGSAGEFYFHPGRYSTTKKTEDNNTILVDGKGQIGEGDAYTQPVPNVDMRTLSYLTGWKTDSQNRIIVEGEAGPAYKELNRFRRSCIWMPGEYILILDDIRTADGKPHNISWQAVTGKAQFEDPKSGRCYIQTEKGQRMDMQILSNKEIDGSIDYQMLIGRWGSELLNKFQFFQNAGAIKFACLMDPWKKKVSMTFSEKDAVVTVTVKGEGFEDVWIWTPAKDLKTPSLIQGTRGGKPLIALTEADKAPHGD